MSDLLSIIGAVGGTIGAVGGVLGVRAHYRTNKIAEASDGRAREERHERLKPPEPAKADLDRRDGHYFATIRMPRSYRALGYVIIDEDGGRRRLDLPPLLEANKPYEFDLGIRPNEWRYLSVSELLLHLWPGDDWACGCGRRIDPSSSEPHWQWRAPVEALPPQPKVW